MDYNTTPVCAKVKTIRIAASRLRETLCVMQIQEMEWVLFNNMKTRMTWGTGIARDYFFCHKGWGSLNGYNVWMGEEDWTLCYKIFGQPLPQKIAGRCLRWHQRRKKRMQCLIARLLVHYTSIHILNNYNSFNFTSTKTY